MTKIFHLTSVHPSQDTRIFYKECISLSRFGYEVTLIAPHDKNETIDEVSIKSLPIPNNRFKRFLLSNWMLLKIALKEDAKVYHFHDPELLPLGLLLKSKGKVVIYDAHEDVPRQVLSKHYIPKFFRGLVAKIFEVFENFAARKMDAVIGATSLIENRFSKIGCHAISIKNYPILTELDSSDCDFSRREKVVCYVGSITKVRGIDEMVEAVRLAETRLLLGGRFAQSSDKQKLLGSPGWQYVEELGFLDRQQVAATLSRSVAGLVVLHPTLNYVDALPVKMFEYMSAGLPVIASDFPILKEIIEKNNCGICVNPLDPKDISQAISWIVRNPREARKMGQNGRKAIEKEYNWDLEKNKLKFIYENLLS